MRGSVAVNLCVLVLGLAAGAGFSGTTGPAEDGEHVVTASSRTLLGLDLDQEEAILAEALLSADVRAVADVLLSSSDIEALAEGFRFDVDDRRDVLEKSEDRNSDPDVVAIKAIATAVTESPEEVRKLVEVMIVSTANEKRVKGRESDLRSELTEILNDTALMRATIEADANKEEPLERKDRRLVSALGALTNRGRSLKCDGCTDANSVVCAHCWTKKVCKPYAWCS